MKFNALMIGSELLQGKIQDKNLSYLAKFLHLKGHELYKVEWVGDDVELICSSMRELSQYPLICSGGLGPTEDDRTKYALAKILNTELSFCEASYTLAQKAYAKLQKTIDANHPYALMPKGLEFFENHRGIAPGLALAQEHCLIFCAPGVPHEFEHMVSQDFFPYILKLRGDGGQQVHSETLTIRTMGLPEEEMFIRRFPQLWKELEIFGELSSLPETSGVTISLNLRSTNHGQLEKLKIQATQFLKAHPIAEYIWGWGEGPIEEFVVKRMINHSQTISISESFTGGLIQTKITSVPGSSQIFPGGHVTYSNAQKTQLLGIAPDKIEHFGVVSREVALDMAKATKEKFKTSFALSTTGIAGPEGGSEISPVGSGWIGLAHDQGEEAFHFRFHGHRHIVQERFARQALFLLLKKSREKSSLV